MPNKKIIIGVATYGRSDYLKACLNSLINLTLPQDHIIELILVDNNREPQAKTILSFIQFPFRVHCFHEKKRGIVHARNRILEEVLALDADYLAFLDDDEIADLNWLVRAISTLSNEFLIVTGPCLFLFEKPAKWLPHSRVFAPKNRSTGEYSGTSSTRNVIFDMRIVFDHALRFEEKLNWVGGSDTYFFIQARALGYRTYWNNHMSVIEQIPESRSTLKWVLKRNLRLGGGRVHRERLQKSKLLVALREFFVAIWILFVGLLETLLLFWLDHHFIRGLERTTHGLGIFYALVGFDFQEYKSHHGC